MIVRALDADGDWTFGRGKNNYLSGSDALAQNIATRLKSFLGDCFFATKDGIDWFNLLGSKNKVALNLAISAVILNTKNVTGLVQLSLSLDEKRNLSITYTVTYANPAASGNTLSDSLGLLLDQSGNFITDESGNPLALES